MYDYKTGKALSDRSGNDKIWQIQKYKYQFYFYKLLIESSYQFSKKQPNVTRGIFQFISPTQPLEIFEVVADETEQKEFEQLLKIVADKIKKLEFPHKELESLKSAKGEWDSGSAVQFVESLLETKTV